MNYRDRMAKGAKNENLLEQCGFCMEEDSLDWMVTVMFYAALHYVSATLEKKYNIRVITHTKRDKMLAVEPRLRSDYKLLHDDASAARYGTGEFSKEYLENRLRPALNRIRNAAEEICLSTPE